MPDPSAGRPIDLPLPPRWRLEALGDAGEKRTQRVDEAPHHGDAARIAVALDLAVELGGVEHAGSHAILQIGGVMCQLAAALRSTHCWMPVPIADVADRLAIVTGAPSDLADRDAGAEQLPNHVPSLPTYQASLLRAPCVLPKRLAACLGGDFYLIVFGEFRLIDNRDLADLNEQLLAACRADEDRLIAGHTQPVGSGMALEREHLLPLAEEGFDLTEVSFPHVDTLGRVKVRTNAYSVPLPPGTTVQVKLPAGLVAIWHAGLRVAQHERCYGRGQEVLDLEHYLDVLVHKPGALAGSKPLEQWRRLGRWPASYDQFWAGLNERLGKAAGTKEMIGLLQLGQSYGPAALRSAIETALQLGAGDSAAVRHLLARPSLEHDRSVHVEIGALAAFERPLPELGEYDQLLAVTR